MSNRFLPRGELIVYTRGRIPNSDRTIARPRRASSPTCPIVVLANRNSASASEIVTGALQDHDRALIVGETTFGKALVQSVYRISEGAGLALTTAHYYTPSGRLIQRPWDETFDEYLTYTLRDQDAERPHDAKRSEAHRRRPAGVQRRRHRAGPAARRARSKASTRRTFGRSALRAPGVRALRAALLGRRRHAAAAVRRRIAHVVGAQLRRGRRDGRGLPAAGGIVAA